MGEAGPEPRHSFLAFHCNFVTKDGEPCSRPLKEGYITACSHLFCYEHAKEWFQNHDDCPLCRSGTVKAVRMDLSQASGKRRDRLLLIGMTPPEILKATETAISFWLDQKVYEFQRNGRRQSQLLSHQKSVEELIKTKLRDAETSCNALEEEQRELQHLIDAREKENCKVSQELQRLRWDLAAAEDRHSQLQNRISGEQRQELFRRPLMEVPTPSQPAAAVSNAPPRASLRGLRKSGFDTPKNSAVLRSDSFQDSAADAPGPKLGALGEFLGAHPSRKLPTFTPGFLGTGRLTKRRIT